MSGLHRNVGERTILSNLSFRVRSGETLFIRGPSGVGKSLLLRCLAYLDVFESGTLKLNGHAPAELGVPRWRALVSYVHQGRVNRPGTPTELYFTAQQLCGQQGRPRGDLQAIAEDLGLELETLTQEWSTLSGGQAQRVQLAIALALKPEVLLLDEPTSALDSESARRVERALKASGAALVWVSHDPSQPARVGGRVLSLPLGTESVVDAEPEPEAAGPSQKQRA